MPTSHTRVDYRQPLCLSYRPQLLEDVEDTLNCTTFEEDSLSRKLSCKRSTITVGSALDLPDDPVLS